MKSKILLENLKIYAVHGVLPEEKVIGNYFIVNAEIHANLEKALETDDLRETINYAEINDIIHDEMKIHSHLLEHVIGRIFKRLESAFPQITFMKIKLTKTNPPMKGEMDGVSVEIEKSLN